MWRNSYPVAVEEHGLLSPQGFDLTLYQSALILHIKKVLMEATRKNIRKTSFSCELESLHNWLNPEELSLGLVIICLLRSRQQTEHDQTDDAVKRRVGSEGRWVGSTAVDVAENVVLWENAEGLIHMWGVRAWGVDWMWYLAPHFIHHPYL